MIETVGSNLKLTIFTKRGTKMRKTVRLTLQMQLLVLTLALYIFSSSVSAQSNTTSENQKPINIGFVLYTKSNTPGTLFARWNYANLYSGPGIATGGPKDGGFTGKYHVRYFYENGEFSDEYELVIEKTGDFYDVSWLIDGKTAAKGVGMEVENGLAVGWRRITDQ